MIVSVRIPAPISSLFRSVPGLPLAVPEHHGGAEKVPGVLIYGVGHEHQEAAIGGGQEHNKPAEQVG